MRSLRVAGAVVGREDTTAQRGILVAILLCGGDKRTQESDIAEAKRLALAWSNS